MKFLDSFFNPSFYKNKEGGFSFWKALSRIVLLYCVIGVIYAVMAYFSFAKNIPSYFAAITTKIENGYPESLILSIKDGQLSKNIQGPLYLYPVASFVPPPRTSSGTTSTASDTPEYFLTVDDSQKISLESYAASNAVFFLGKDGFVGKSSRETKMQSYKGMGGDIKEQKDFSFSKDTLLHVIALVGEYVPMIPSLIVAGIIIFYPLGATFGALLFSFFLALIIMLLSKKLMIRSATYGESYILALYALPSVIVVLKIASCIPYISSVASFPFVMTLLVIGFIWCMFRGAISQEEVGAHGTL